MLSGVPNNGFWNPARFFPSQNFRKFVFFNLCQLQGFFDEYFVVKSHYCRIQRNWRLGLRSNSEERCGRIFLKFLHNNLALIYIHFCQLEIFSDQRRFFWNVEKKKWSGFLEYFRNGQLERNFLCYESCRKNIFGYLF
jgi:hypothetical protein